MYRIGFFEGGRFLTEIGSPVRTVGEALVQIERLLNRVGHENADGYCGVRWTRADGTVCALLVCSTLCTPITDKDFQKE